MWVRVRENSLRKKWKFCQKKKKTYRYVSLRIFYRLYGNSGSFLTVTRRVAAYHGGGYHGGLSRYHLFLVAAPTCHLTLTRRLWINRPTFVLGWLQKKTTKPCAPRSPRAAQRTQRKRRQRASFALFWLRSGWDCAPSTTKQPRPKVHLQV